MRVEINQSNKVEQTNKDTIVGISNKKSFTILIKRKTKRKLQEELSNLLKSDFNKDIKYEYQGKP